MRADPAALERNREMLGWILLPLMLLVSWLMVSNIRFPSFKKVTWDARTRARGFVLLIVVGLAGYVFKETAVPTLFVGYILYGIYRHLFLLGKDETDPAPDDDGL
jgi:CDP-diacylglycerol--serine O-phosphatidyltransferase